MASAYFGLLAVTSSKSSIVGIQNKIRAEQYASELLEYFLSLSPNELQTFLKTNPIDGTLSNSYPLCAHINLLDRDPSHHQTTPYNANPTVDIPNWPGANRFYQIQVVNMVSMTPNAAVCGTSPSYFLTDSTSNRERYLITVGVTYPRVQGSKTYDRVVLSSVMAKTMAKADLKLDSQDGPVALTTCGGTSSLSWTTTNTSSCTVKNGATTLATGTNGSVNVSNLNPALTYTFTLDCNLTNGGSAGDSVTTTPLTAGTHKAFVTSTTYSGSGVGSIANANAICQARATAAGLTGTYKAILSDSATDAKNLLSFSGRITAPCKLGGVACPSLIADDQASFWIDWKSPIGCDENGTLRNTSVWTGTSGSGTKNSPYCGSPSWSSSSAFLVYGTTGSSGSTGSGRLNNSTTGGCSSGRSLYCVSQ